METGATATPHVPPSSTPVIGRGEVVFTRPVRQMGPCSPPLGLELLGRQLDRPEHMTGSIELVHELHETSIEVCDTAIATPELAS